MRLSAFVISILIATGAHAGAWVMPKGEGLFIAQASYYSSSNYYNVKGDKVSQPRYGKYELQPYVEYGALSWLTIGGSAYLQTVSQSSFRNYGLADPELFARAEIYKDNTQVFSLQPFLKLPSTFVNSGMPRGGSKSTDAELSLLYGRNIRLLSGTDYLDTRIGYRIRDQGLSDQIRVDAAVGLGITNDIQLVPALRGIYSTDFKTAPVFSEGGDLDGNVLKAEITGIYHLDDRRWLQAGFFSPVLGKQTGGGYGASIGFAQRF